MPAIDTWEGVLWLFSGLATAALLVRLIAFGFVRQYQFFVAFLALALVRDVLFASGWLSKQTYGLVYFWSELLNLFLFTLITLELFSLILSKYPGIQSVSKWFLSGSLGISMVLAVFSLYPDMAKLQQFQFGINLGTLFVINRGVYCALVLLILMMAFFLVWYPVRLSRNVVVHSFVFALYFLGKALVVLYRNLGGDSRAASSGILIFSAVCVVAWNVLITRTGEQTEMVVGHAWDRDEEQRLLEQLEGLNSAVGRIARE